LIITLAGFENALPGIVGGVISTSNAVIDVLAEMLRIWACRVTNLQAEEIAADEVVPLNDLGKLVLVGPKRV